MFLATPNDPDALAYMEKDRQATGYLMSHERAWALRPDVAEGFTALRMQLVERSSLTKREIALLVCAGAQAMGDSLCSLAWGGRLASLVGPEATAEVLRGRDPADFDARETALRRWASQVARHPNETTSADVDALRAAGLSEREIFEATLWLALRVAYSTVNDALGARPDPELLESTPAPVREAVTYGRS